MQAITQEAKATVADLKSLDNPIWNALNSVHKPLALLQGLAARYPADVCPLVGLRAPTPKAFADLAQLVSAGETVALFTTEPLDVPRDWTVTRGLWIDQMVCERPPAAPRAPLLELQQKDVPDMLELTAATEPGPFLPGTIRMGRYRGLRSADGRLMAMAGERLRLEAFTETSAVCTAPEFRGHGHARTLVLALASTAYSEGRTPFLHVKTDNGAKHLYKRLGFRVRRPIRFTLVSPRS